MKNAFSLLALLMFVGISQAHAEMSCDSDDLFPWSLAPNSDQGLESGSVRVLDSKGQFVAGFGTVIELVYVFSVNHFAIRFIDEPKLGNSLYAVTCRDR